VISFKLWRPGANPLRGECEAYRADSGSLREKESAVNSCLAGVEFGLYSAGSGPHGGALIYLFHGQSEKEASVKNVEA
jgi:hypothetical protein